MSWKNSANRAPKVWFVKKGKQLYFEDKFLEAIKYSNQAKELDLENSDSWSCRGLCYYEFDENKEAIDNFDRALYLNLNDARSFDYRSKAKGKQP